MPGSLCATPEACVRSTHTPPARSGGDGPPAVPTGTAASRPPVPDGPPAGRRASSAAASLHSGVS
eukprot:14590988-Alexandrium_andersonii.AAC.1